MENQEVESPNGRIHPESWLKWAKWRAKKVLWGCKRELRFRIIAKHLTLCLIIRRTRGKNDKMRLYLSGPLYSVIFLECHKAA